mgnify:CR=1 FL=1
MKRLLGEFLTIVVGVLVALGVDEWRQERADLEVAREHLGDVASELRGNLCTVHRVRALQLARKLENLQTVIDFLNRPDAAVADPAALLRAFAWSAAAVRPWLSDNQYNALVNSGNVRLLRKLHPALDLGGLYEGPEVLFSQVQRLHGDYPRVVNELLPAQFQAETNPMRSYARGAELIVLRDDPDLARAVDEIRARGAELLRLARNEAAAGTASEIVLLRIRQDIEASLVMLAPWDRERTPVAELLEQCANARLPIPAASGR